MQKDKKGTIYKTNRLIRGNLIKAIGTVFGQDTLIQFSETRFARIVESLRLLYFPTLLEDSDEDSYTRNRPGLFEWTKGNIFDESAIHL